MYPAGVDEIGLSTICKPLVSTGPTWRFIRGNPFFNEFLTAGVIKGSTGGSIKNKTSLVVIRDIITSAWTQESPNNTTGNVGFLVIKLVIPPISFCLNSFTLPGPKPSLNITLWLSIILVDSAINMIRISVIMM